MKFSPCLVALVLTAQPLAWLQAGDGVLDLTSLHNYAGQTAPTYITRNNTPGNNAIANAAATLGRVLFYDKRLSRYDTSPAPPATSRSLPSAIPTRPARGRWHDRTPCHAVDQRPLLPGSQVLLG